MCLIKKQKNGYLELCQLLMKKKLWAQGNLSLLLTKSPQKQTPLKEPQAFWTGDALHMSHQARGRVVEYATWVVDTALCSLQSQTFETQKEKAALHCST